MPERKKTAMKQGIKKQLLSTAKCDTLEIVCGLRSMASGWLQRVCRALQVGGGKGFV